jgi:hypothetical protein
LNWIEEAKLTAPDAAAEDEFGGAVAIDGGRVAVGARFDDDGSRNAGAAYVLPVGRSEDCDDNQVPDECQADTDADGVIDDCDNCPDIPNPDQADGNGNSVGDACDAPTLLAAASGKLHGTNEDLDIDLPISGSAGAVETRMGGPERVVLTFSEPIQAEDGMPDATEVDLTCDGIPCGSVDDMSITDSNMTVNLSDVPDGTCLAIALSGIIDLDAEPLAGDNDVHVQVLQGNVNGDTATNLIDVSFIKAMDGTPLDADTARFDLNLDGSIDLIDMALAKSLNGGSASCP